MNERRQRLDHPAADASLKCECECRRVECGSGFNVNLERYEDVRAHARRFVVAHGHENPGESIISSTPDYLVIEKVGTEGNTAEALNPR